MYKRYTYRTVATWLLPWYSCSPYYSSITLQTTTINPTMSSSINIPTRSHGESSKAATSSSSISSYSTSPQTPGQQSQQTAMSTSLSSSPNSTYGHDRRRSLLSMSPLCSVVTLQADIANPKASHACCISGELISIIVYWFLDRLFVCTTRTYCNQHWWSWRCSTSGEFPMSPLIYYRQQDWQHNT